jgi:hypothetical protein
VAPGHQQFAGRRRSALGQNEPRAAEDEQLNRTQGHRQESVALVAMLPVRNERILATIGVTVVVDPRSPLRP